MGRSRFSQALFSEITVYLIRMNRLSIRHVFLSKFVFASVRANKFARGKRSLNLPDEVTKPECLMNAMQWALQNCIHILRVFIDMNKANAVDLYFYLCIIRLENSLKR